MTEVRESLFGFDTKSSALLKFGMQRRLIMLNEAKHSEVSSEILRFTPFLLVAPEKMPRTDETAIEQSLPSGEAKKLQPNQSLYSQS